MQYAVRPAREEDLDTLADIVIEGMETFREFAGEDWRPPPLAHEREGLRERLLHPRSWTLVGVTADGAIAGHVAFLPATAAGKSVIDARLAHLYHLFVRPQHWGTGLAATLIREAHSTATAQGYAAMRLFTPALQQRARRFYEREGWSAVGDPVYEPHLGLELVEYRLALS